MENVAFELDLADFSQRQTDQHDFSPCLEYSMSREQNAQGEVVGNQVGLADYV